MTAAALKQALLDEIAGQKDRLFLWMPVAFGGGIACYFSLGQEPSLAICAGAAAGLLPLVYVFYRLQHRNNWWLAAFLLACGLALGACGFLAAKAQTQWGGTPILAHPVKIAAVTGEVESVEKLEGTDGSRVILKHLTIEKITPEDTPVRIRLRFRKDEGLAPGQTISTLARIDAPSEPVLPGAYDFRRHLFFGRIGGVGFAFKTATVLTPATPGRAGLLMENLRRSTDARIAAVAGPVTAGIMSALITGSRGTIAKTDNDAMRGSGLYHLLSISGTHVSLVAGAIFFSARLLMACVPWLALHWPIKKIAAALALAGTIFYVFLAGADVPAQRSLIMTGLVLFAVMIDRSPLSLRLIAFSALVVLVVQPYSLIGVSFQMSFAAVAALICFYDYIRPRWMTWHARAGVIRKTLLYFIGLVLTSLIAGAATGFFSLYHFQNFAVYSVISNMLAVPLTGIVIMPAAILSMLAMPFGLDYAPLKVMEWGCLWMLTIAHWAAGLDGAVIHVRQWPPATLMSVTAGLTLLLVWHGWYGKGLAAIIILTGLLTGLRQPSPDLMVSGSGRLIGVRQGHTLYVSDRRREKFEATSWLRLMGREGDQPRSFQEESSPARCDDQGCRLTIEGRKIAIAYSRTALYEDRDWADLLISTLPVRRDECNTGAACLDFYDFKDNGAYAIYLGGSGIRFYSVRADLGSRPWSQ